MTIEIGTKVRIIKTDVEGDEFATEQGYYTGNIGEVVRKDERLSFISLPEEFTVRFPETDENEGWFFTAEEEGVFWERAE